MVVAGRAHLAQIRKQTPDLPSEHIILEGMARNTGPSVALAALRLISLQGDGIMVIVPSDHWIQDELAFRRAIQSGIHAVKRTDGLIALGIKARSANPGFGYVRLGKRCPGTTVRKASGFVEKPSRAKARRLVRSSRWLWNSGIFVWRAGRILEELRIHRPDVLRGLQGLASPPPGGPWVVPPHVMRRSKEIAIDRAVLEKSKEVRVAMGHFEWSDLGTWDSVAMKLEHDSSGNAVYGKGLFLDAKGCVSVNAGGLTVLSGVRNLLVIRGDDCVLVVPRDDPRRVRDAVSAVGRRFPKWV
jgi:mannose-1-phosphate guanylyltransferase